jgi:hypothetical protein
VYARALEPYQRPRRSQYAINAIHGLWEEFGHDDDLEQFEEGEED